MPFKVGNTYSRGRPKGSTNQYSIQDFKRALAKVEKEDGYNFYEDCIRKAKKDTKLKVAILSKLLPSMIAQDHSFPEDLLEEFISIVPTNGKKMPEDLARFVN